MRPRLCHDVHMRRWIVRLIALYLFDLIVLVLIGLITTRVQVPFPAVLWAALILAFATMWVKPAVHGALRSLVKREGDRTRSKFAEFVVQAVIVYAVALAVWVVVVWLTNVRTEGFLSAYLLPPIALLLAWGAYSLISGAVEKGVDDAVSKAFDKPEGDTKS